MLTVSRWDGARVSRSYGFSISNSVLPSTHAGARDYSGQSARACRKFYALPSPPKCQANVMGPTTVLSDRQCFWRTKTMRGGPATEVQANRCQDRVPEQKTNHGDDGVSHSRGLRTVAVPSCDPSRGNPAEAMTRTGPTNPICAYRGNSLSSPISFVCRFKVFSRSSRPDRRAGSRLARPQTGDLCAKRSIDLTE